MADAVPSPLRDPLRRPFRLEPVQVALVGLLAVEITVFSVTGTNFATLANGLQVLRLGVELGLLAVALTPVIVSGGIDLSVGSLMGLSAVVFGKLWRDAGHPIPLAAIETLALGALAGGLNGALVTRLRLPPLIVTLGTFSLFRGLAEAITRGVDNFTDFPGGFRFWGQGDLFGTIPAQLPVFVAVAFAFWLLLQRSTIGRALVAIGYSPEGARHAGLPVARLLVLVYVLAGLVSSLAALIYVAHLGQAKSDAGTGYELLAITAVVLGGTSIFGGRGGVVGTLLGWLAIAVLQNGLRLSDLPGELAGVLTGTLLLLTIGFDRWTGRARRPSISKTEPQGDFVVRNSQVALICVVILAAAGIVAASNVWLARTLVPSLTSRASGDLPDPSASDREPDLAKPITVALMPKSKGNAYFIACREGAEEAARELGVTLIWDGPTDPDPARQNAIIDTWITRGVDVIAVAVENRDGISDVLRKAQDHGIRVMTWDADADPDARSFFVNQATPEGIGRTLMDNAAAILGDRGQFAIITASLTASNMIAWQEAIEARRQEKYPEIQMAALRPCDDKQGKAFDEANTILSAYPDVKLIMAICSTAVPGAAEAVKQSGRDDVKVVGLGLPNDNKRYVHEGITEAVVLWNTQDLGYLTVHAAHDLVSGRLKPGDSSYHAGRLGTLSIEGDNIILGQPFTFTEENIDQFDF